MIIHAKDSPALRRQLIDANGKRVPGFIQWANLDTGEICRCKLDEMDQLTLEPDRSGQMRIVTEIVMVPAPVSCLPMD